MQYHSRGSKNIEKDEENLSTVSYFLEITTVNILEYVLLVLFFLYHSISLFISIFYLRWFALCCIDFHILLL